MKERKMSDTGAQMSRFWKIAGVAFGTGILLCTGLSVVLPDEAYSAQEKRSLAQLPKVSLSTLADGSFMDEIEEYGADQFPGRTLWMTAKTAMDRLLGQNESQGVFACDDGYLMETFEKPDEENLNETLDSIKDFAKNYSSSNLYFLLAPNAVSVYNELLPDDAITEDQNTYINTVYSALETYVTCIDVRDVFEQEKENTQLYYYTDHHWTTQGAYLAYQCAADVMGLSMETVYETGVICNDFSGSLASKSGFVPEQKDVIQVFVPTESEEQVLYTVTYEKEMEKTASCYQTAYLDSDDPYQVFFGGNHAILTINTSLDSERSLLVLKDSYANCFIPFLIDQYRTITVVDPRYYYDDIDILVQTNEYTDVLFMYNVNTLSEDTNLKVVLQNQQ